jgi:hypothetical protein
MLTLGMITVEVVGLRMVVEEEWTAVVVEV